MEGICDWTPKRNILLANDGGKISIIMSADTKAQSRSSVDDKSETRG